MTTVNDILNFMEEIAPSSMKMDWDNVGLLCGSPNAPVTKVLIALDPFEHVCQEAADLGAQLILTHHPIIFNPLSKITDQSSITRGIMVLCRHGISAINAHTNLDCAPGGVNDVLAEVLGLKDVSVIDPNGVDVHGKPWGLLRMGFCPSQPLPQFLKFVKDQLDCQGLRYVDGGKPVHRVAVGGGACGSEIAAVAASGCDTFVTSDIKYNQFWDAKELGLNLIDAGHFHTENPVCRSLTQKLQHEFPEITVTLSKIHTDCMNFF